MNRTSLRPALLLLALLASCGFCASRTMKMLVHMTDEQLNFLQTQILPRFEQESGVKVLVNRYQSFSEIDSALEALKDTAGLVKIPFVKGWELVDKGRILPLSSVLSQTAMDEVRAVFACNWLSTRNNERYFLPRKFETRIMAYRPSKVMLALQTWQRYSADIDSSLSKINGRGLPKGYTLEGDLSQWDFYDIYVAGFVWSRTAYGGVKKPRIAHRGKLYDGTSLRIIDRVYQCGGDSASVFNMEDKSVVEAYSWEAAYAWGGIYDSTMWVNQWTGENLWDAFLGGSIFLGFLTQLDCITILNKELGPGAAKSATADFATAIMPRGCSLQLDGSGTPLRLGTHRVTTGGWWWGIPQRCADPATAYKLARFLTNRENQIRECRQFGMVPVRVDVIKDPRALFSGGPITEVFKTSYTQIQTNDKCVLPGSRYIDGVSRCYLDAWKYIVIDRHWAPKEGQAPDVNYVASVLKKDFAARARKAAGGAR